MRIAVAILLISLQVPASAFDSRGVQIGQSCRHVAELELSLGTVPRQEVESMIRRGILAFEDRSVAGLYAQYLYNCKETSGFITRYSIDVRTDSESRAREIFADARAAAVARLGVPEFDFLAPEAKEKVRQARFQGLKWEYGIADWGTVENQRVRLSLVKHSDNGEWSVVTIVSAVSQESPNKSLERTREK
jgi:hypothetical protein